MVTLLLDSAHLEVALSGSERLLAFRRQFEELAGGIEAGFGPRQHRVVQTLQELVDAILARTHAFAGRVRRPWQ